MKARRLSAADRAALAAACEITGVRAKTASNPPKGPPPPVMTTVDVSAGLRAALLALSTPSRPRYLVVWTEGSAVPAVCSRLEAAWYFAGRGERRVADLLETEPAAGFIATMRIGPSWSAAGAIVGALRLDVERPRP